MNGRSELVDSHTLNSEEPKDGRHDRYGPSKMIQKPNSQSLSPIQLEYEYRRQIQSARRESKVLRMSGGGGGNR